MRRLPLPLLAVPAALGAGAFAMEALQTSAERRGFSLSISPARQTAAPGQRASFSVTVGRSGGPVSLRASRLPRGVRATFRLSNGKPGRVVPGGQDGAILTLIASRKAGLGGKRVTIQARSRGRTRKRSVLLTLVSSRSRVLTLAARPARRTVLAAETATYRVQVQRRGRSPLRLAVRGLPSGVRASWSPPLPLRGERSRTRLRLRVGRDVEPSSRRLVIYARGRRARRDAVIVLRVREGREFAIGGDLGPLLYPGRSEPLELVLSNPNDFTLKVTGLGVAIRPATSNPGCGSDNYAVAQYSGPYPLSVPPGSTRLGELVSDGSLWPKLSMLNLPADQDACKNARVSLDYSGQARR